MQIYTKGKITVNNILNAYVGCVTFENKEFLYIIDNQKEMYILITKEN